MTSEELTPEQRKEITRLTSADPPFPSFGRWLWDKHPWPWFNVPMGTVLYVTVGFVYNTIFPWWVIMIAGGLLGAALGNTFGFWRVWTKRRVQDQETRDLVTKWSTGEGAFPESLSWAIVHWIDEGKTNVAAAAALEFFKHERPEEWTAFDAMPEDEKERLRLEAMQEFDRNREERPW